MSDIRVLVVDDSAFVRIVVTRALEGASDIKVVGTARDGIDALEKIATLKPDVVTLDVEMPRLDGISTLKRIMTECPTPVVMLSSLTGAGKETTIRALEIGAVDFFLKQTAASPTGKGNELQDKVRTAAYSKLVRLPRTVHTAELAINRDKPIGGEPDAVVIIGSSTGGPRALYQVIPSLPCDTNLGFLVVQHMPPGFTKSLADRLNSLSQVGVTEACAGSKITRGNVLIAPGGYHVVIERDGTLSLNQGPTVNGVRPAVDVTMLSAAPVFGSELLGVILTGMGSDGTRGCEAIKANGGKVIVEDESTCVVWGMPRSVFMAGYADTVAPLPEITRAIAETKLVSRSAR
jgi:two-component system, chemotaxis family, protein-glutamate methylesterase/glutaminase